MAAAKMEMLLSGVTSSPICDLEIQFWNELATIWILGENPSWLFEK